MSDEVYIENKKKVTEFAEYVYSFYGGPNKLYDLGFEVTHVMIAKAILILIKCNWDFAGDSVDREMVRDIMILMNR